MTKRILIRDVPDEVYEWIENQRHSMRMSQKELLLKVLENASGYKSDNRFQPSLFGVTPLAHSANTRHLHHFTFIDLFAGIGGMRLALDRAGGKNVFSCRRLTPRECARLQGFPDELNIVVSDTQAYRQFGNALVPIIAEAVAKCVLAVFKWHDDKQKVVHATIEEMAETQIIHA